MAAPKGTAIYAPAAGVIRLSDPDLYFEGGTLFIDHGSGLTSVMMHLSKLDAVEGQQVKQGEKIGEIGATGRATGPHLHWSVKWNNRYYIDPSAALALDLSALYPE